MKGHASGIEGSRLKELREVVARNPASAGAQLNLGTALLKAGFVAKAEVSLRRAVELDPNFAEAWSNLGGALLSRWDFAGCITANRRALELKPDLVQAHYNLGLGHLYNGDTAPMVSCFRKVIELEPENAGAHYHLALGLHAQGHIERARSSLDKAMALGYTPEPEFLRAMERHGPPSPVEPPRRQGGSRGGAKVDVSKELAHTFEFGPGSESDQ